MFNRSAVLSKTSFTFSRMAQGEEFDKNKATELFFKAVTKPTIDGMCDFSDVSEFCYLDKDSQVRRSSDPTPLEDVCDILKMTVTDMICLCAFFMSGNEAQKDYLLKCLWEQEETFDHAGFNFSRKVPVYEVCLTALVLGDLSEDQTKYLVSTDLVVTDNLGKRVFPK